MAWELEISTIDVGQGESSLVIARDNGGPGGTRAMLIDGARGGWAGFIHTYVAGRLAALGVPQLNHILTTHYDADHANGIVTLLVSDNLWALCQVLGQAASAAWLSANAFGWPAGDCTAAAAAAAAAAARGGYGPYAFVAVNAGIQGAGLHNPTPAAGARVGREYADAQPHVSPRLIVTTTSVGRAAVAAALGAAGAAGAVGPAAAGALNALRSQVKNWVNTGGLYRNVHVIDIGHTDHQPAEYAEAITGRVYYKNGTEAVPPGTNRMRTIVRPANLGAELLWNTGPAPIAAPADSPAAFLVATRKWIWRAPNGACPIASGEPDNDDSIAMVIRFGQFFFYTGGDLPSVGENLVAASVMANGFPNPQGGPAFAPPNRIAALKCGHHGSQKSTSSTFLAAINPCAAFVSCGKNTFGTGDKHPDQILIDRLNARAAINPFYLTNCTYPKFHVPASTGGDQLAILTNRSRVSGDNAQNNKGALRNRGNIRLYLDQAESTAPAGPGRRFHVDYWENLPNLLAPMFLGAHPAFGLTPVNHPF